jgi:mannose-6-phosphate isomerase-like protein (cupin superfamily)
MKQSKARWILALGFWGAFLAACSVSPALRRGQPWILGPGEGKRLDVLGESITVKVDPSDTGGAYAIVEEVSGPGGGPPPHVHAHEDEVFYVLEGNVEFLVGDRTVPGKPGSTGVLPRGVPHTFRNVGPSPSKVLVVISPGGFTRFFEEIDGKARSGPLSKEEATKIAERYGLTILPPPGGSK